jgi:hypothetical protein
MEITDTRRFFRNRFECYVDNKDASGVGVRDEVHLSLRDVCELLEADMEPFPRRYDRDMKKLCGHEYLTWFREMRTYGDVARLLNRKLAGENGSMPHVGGRWVQAVLANTRQPSV